MRMIYQIGCTLQVGNVLRISIDFLISYHVLATCVQNLLEKKQDIA